VIRAKRIGVEQIDDFLTHMETVVQKKSWWWFLGVVRTNNFQQPITPQTSFSPPAPVSFDSEINC
jgi:hypothetical protein